MVNRSELDLVIDTVRTARVHYRLWEEFMKRRAQQYVDLVDSGYSTVIEYTRKAHFKAYVVELHKLIETRKDTLNLEKVFKACDKDELKNEIEKYKQKTSATSKGLFILRNSVEAHTSAKVSPDQAFQKASISSQDIDEFIQHTGQILNRIQSAYFSQQDAFIDMGEPDSVSRLYSAMGEHEKI